MTSNPGSAQAQEWGGRRVTLLAVLTLVVLADEYFARRQADN